MPQESRKSMPINVECTGRCDNREEEKARCVQGYAFGPSSSSYKPSAVLLCAKQDHGSGTTMDSGTRQGYKYKMYKNNRKKGGGDILDYLEQKLGV